MTITQIDMMKHCIGFERRHVKRGKYKPYRNYYNTGDEKDSDWDELVEQGLAKEFKRYEQYIYCLSVEGIKTLEKILDVEILDE